MLKYFQIGDLIRGECIALDLFKDGMVGRKDILVRAVTCLLHKLIEVNLQSILALHGVSKRSMLPLLIVYSCSAIKM